MSESFRGQLLLTAEHMLWWPLTGPLGHLARQLAYRAPNLPCMAVWCDAAPFSYILTTCFEYCCCWTVSHYLLLLSAY